jgi:tight adherence protein C
MADLLQSFGAGGVDWIVYLSLAMVFAMVVLMVFGVGSLVDGRTSLKQRVGATGRAASVAKRPRAGSIRFSDDANAFGRVLGPVAKRLIPTDLADVSKTRLMLVQAGYMRSSAIGVFYVTRIVLALALPLGTALLLPMVMPSLGSTSILLYAAIGGIAGLYLPNLWISRRTSSLQLQYRLGFPDALDLLVICVEAGLGIDAAFSRIGQELVGAHRRLGEHFALMSVEMRAGSTRQDALRNLADRLGIDEVRSLVTLLMHSEELGTSIADALRVYSDEMRSRRMLNAEVKANALSVKLSIPLALFVFPVIMTVIMLPVVIRIIRTLGKI